MKIFSTKQFIFNNRKKCIRKICKKVESFQYSKPENILDQNPFDRIFDDDLEKEFFE